MGGEDRGGLLDLDPKSRSGFLTSRLIPTLRDRSRWPSRSFKMFEVSYKQSGLSPIYPDFPRFIPTFLDFSQLSSIFPDLFLTKKPKKNWGKLRFPPRSRSRFVKKSGWPFRSRSRPDPTLCLSRYYPPRDISPMVASESCRGCVNENLKVAIDSRTWKIKCCLFCWTTKEQFLFDSWFQQWPVVHAGRLKTEIEKEHLLNKYNWRTEE